MFARHGAKSMISLWQTSTIQRAYADLRSTWLQRARLLNHKHENNLAPLSPDDVERGLQGERIAHMLTATRGPADWTQYQLDVEIQYGVWHWRSRETRRFLDEIQYIFFALEERMRLVHEFESWEYA